MENIQFIIKDYQLDKLGIGNVLKNLISALGVNDDTVIECYDDYVYGNYNTILDDKFIYKGLVEEYDADLKLKQLKSQQEYNAISNANSNNECNVDGCEKGASKNISYSDFKNKHKINQN